MNIKQNKINAWSVGKKPHQRTQRLGFPDVREKRQKLA